MLCSVSQPYFILLLYEAGLFTNDRPYQLARQTRILSFLAISSRLEKEAHSPAPGTLWSSWLSNNSFTDWAIFPDRQWCPYILKVELTFYGLLREFHIVYGLALKMGLALYSFVYSSSSQCSWSWLKFDLTEITACLVTYVTLCPEIMDLDGCPVF